MGVFGVVLFLNGCTACNIMLPSKKIKVPPYVINYYHFDSPEELQKAALDETLPSEQWHEHSWDDRFRMEFFCPNLNLKFKSGQIRNNAK